MYMAKRVTTISHQITIMVACCPMFVSWRGRPDGLPELNQAARAAREAWKRQTTN